MRFRGAEFAAVGTGLFVGEFVGLLSEEEFECALGESVSRGGGDLFHGSEVDIEPGSVVAEGPLGDDFGPLPCKVVELSELLGCEAGRRHGLSCLAVASMTGRGFPIPPSKHRKTPDKP